MYEYIRFAVRMSDQPISSDASHTKIFLNGTAIHVSWKQMLECCTMEYWYGTQYMNLILIDSFDSNLF